MSKTAAEWCIRISDNYLIKIKEMFETRVRNTHETKQFREWMSREEKSKNQFEKAIGFSTQPDFFQGTGRNHFLQTVKAAD